MALSSNGLDVIFSDREPSSINSLLILIGDTEFRVEPDVAEDFAYTILELVREYRGIHED